MELITSQSPTAHQTYTKTTDELNGLPISDLIQSKIQEVLYEVALKKLIENETSDSGKAFLLSLSLPQPGAWLSAVPIPALGLHLLSNKFRAAAKYKLGAPIYEKEKKSPYCKIGLQKTLGDHAVTCHGRGDMISQHNIFFRFQRCQHVASLRAEKSESGKKTRPGDDYLSCW